MKRSSQRIKIFIHYFILLMIAAFVASGFDIIQPKNKDKKTNKINADDLMLLNNKPQKDQRYVSAGRRCYIIGMEDGNFPPQGWHIVDEMGGIWVPPLKAADGIWLRINGEYISSAKKYTRKAAWSEFDFHTDGLIINRKDAALDSLPGALMIYSIKNNSGADKKLSFEIVTRFHPILSYPFVQGNEDYLKNKSAFEFKTLSKYDASLSCLIVSTDKFKRFVVCKTSISPDSIYFTKQNDLPVPKSKSFFQDNESDAVMRFNKVLKTKDEIKLIVTLTGSVISAEDAASAAGEILKNADQLLKDKENKFVELAGRTILITPDETINKAFLWNKLNTAMEIISVPELGTGAVAGYPDYPWYFGNDGSFSVPGLLAIGQIEEAKDHLRLVASSSNRVNNSSGKIVHEIVTDGTVYWGHNTDPGNTNETCQFAKASGQIWRWTGDEKFLREVYPTVKKGMLDWLVNSQIEKGDIFPSGFGNAEVLGWGSKRLDVQCYAVEGFLSLADMAHYLGDNESEKKAKQWAEKIRDGINRIWWMEDKGYYANSLTKDNKPVLSGEISPVPLESKIADPAKAGILLNLISKSKLNNKYGWGDMSIGAGIAASAEANYGKAEGALRYIKGIANLWNVEMPGGLPEHNPPYPLNPEHKQWRTNAVQLWGGYGLHAPIIKNILGVEPDIPNNIIRVIPNLPVSWNRIECSNLLAGKDTLNLLVQQGKKQISIKLTCAGNEKLEAGAFLPPQAKLKKVTLNGTEYPMNNVTINNVLEGKEVFIKTDLHELLLQIEIE